MSKRHYIEIANAIRLEVESDPSTYYTRQQMLRLANVICVQFALDNKLFSRAKFLAACGLTP